MRFPTAALVAGFLATSTALLLPPPSIDEIKEEFKDARFTGAPKHFKDLIYSLLEEKTTTVDLQCPGCPFALMRSEGQDIETTLWKKKIENVIHLQLDTHDDGLNVNDVPLYPLDRRTTAPALVAHQIATRSGVESAELELEFVLGTHPHTTPVHEDGAVLHIIELTILSIDNVPVRVNSVLIKMIQTSENNYVIVQTEQIPFKVTPGAISCEDSRHWTLCRVKAIISEMLRQIVERTKAKANKAKGWVKNKSSDCKKHHHSKGRPSSHGELPRGRRPHHPHRAQHHGKHHRFHRLSHAIHQTLRFFIVPALLGVIGGLAASAIGMLVGQAIIFVWFRTYRSGQRGPLRIYQREVASIAEKEEFLRTDEAMSRDENVPQNNQITLSRDVEAGAISPRTEEQ